MFEWLSAATARGSIFKGHYTISVDGKIMIWAELRIYSEGRTIYYNRVFERQ
jgi:hypothetical protein